MSNIENILERIEVRVKPGAYDTIDNITKFALNDDDYYEVKFYSSAIPIIEEKKQK